ncbi:hypothetical protein D3C74_446820 [compost metagenome]
MNNQLKQQIRGLSIKRQIPHLVDDQQLVAFEAPQLIVQFPAVMRRRQPLHPASCRIKECRVPLLASLDAQSNAQVGFPHPRRS